MSDLSIQLSCLYYPFSRLLDSATLKYLLLIFDSVTFLDSAQNAEWRRVLLQNMARESPIFSSFEELANDYDLLSETGAVQILTPPSLKTKESIQVALATKADLSDPKFVGIASNPSSFGLPAKLLGSYHRSPYHRSSSDRPTWQVFKSKIAKPLLTNKEFLEDKEWTSHILIPGDDIEAWTLSYEAGSAAVVNFYLEAAQELKLAPVTTSQLHHELVLRKLKRVFADDESKIDLIDDSERKRYRTIFGQGEIINLLGGLFPASQLNKISFAEILKFREETQELRKEFLREINNTIRVIDSDPATATYDKEVILAVRSLEEEFKKLEKELVVVRDKVLPAFAGALMYGTAGGSALGALVTFLGGLSPVGLVAASALTISGAFLAKATELWNEKKKTLRNQSSSVSYLTRVSKLVKR